MSEFGVDYSFARPSIDTLKAHGVKFVCRYVSTPGNGKNLTPSEAAFLTGAGIRIVTIFETTANRALSGSGAGMDDARSARAQARECGQPNDSPIYYAVDFRPDSNNIEEVKAYFRGVGSVDGVLHTGVYGSYYTCRTLIAYGLACYAWQTYAWSDGKWAGGVNIRQVLNGLQWPGGEVDHDVSITPDYGQWPQRAAVPPGGLNITTEGKIMEALPVIKIGSKDVAGAMPFVRRAQAIVREVYGESMGGTGRYHDGVDGDYGALTARAVKMVQERAGITADGVVGPQTWTLLYTGSAK